MAKAKKTDRELVLEYLVKARHLTQDNKAEARMEKNQRLITEWDELDVLIGRALQWAIDLKDK